MQHACSLSRLDLKGCLRPSLTLPSFILKASPHAQVLTEAFRRVMSFELTLHLQRVLQFLAQVEEGDIDGAIEKANSFFWLTILSASLC